MGCGKYFDCKMGLIFSLLLYKKFKPFFLTKLYLVFVHLIIVIDWMGTDGNEGRTEVRRVETRNQRQGGKRNQGDKRDGETRETREMGGTQKGN